jgi:adenylate cyclase
VGVTASRRLAAIMFTDMVGYSAMAQEDEEAALRALALHNRTLRPFFEKFQGREVKTMGDAFLLEFGSTLDAVQCALEIQRHLRTTQLAGPGDRPIQIRIGIHAGDVIEDDGDVLGDAVNVASRIEPLATPGGICITRQVYDQVQNKVGAVFVKLPPVSLKNISAPTEVYRIVGEAGPLRPSARKAVGSDEKHLAVLPLANIGHDPDDEYFAEGLTDELISVLSQIRGLSVIARTSVIQYKSTPKPIAVVGIELGVDVVLEGSVRRDGNRVRVTLQLVDAETQRHLWAGSVNRDLNDVFAVQAYVAARAARALRMTLSKTRRSLPRTPPPPNPRWGTVTGGEAYDSYLRGLALASRPSEGGPEEAFRCFELATRLDPSLADAYAAWANLYTIAAGDYFPMREAMPHAKELAARALALDPDSSDAHAALANIALQFDNDWGLAESEFIRATQLNPSNVTAYRFYGTLLRILNRLDEAKEAYRHAIRLDPTGHDRIALAWVEIEAGNPKAAIDDVEALPRDGPHAGHYQHILSALYLSLGRREDAIKAFEASPAPTSDDERFDRALQGALLGRKEPALTILNEYERGASKSYTSQAHAAMMYAAVGDNDRALDLLEKDFREGDHVLWLYYRHDAFASIRSLPRFVAILREMQLPLTVNPRSAKSK